MIRIECGDCLDVMGSLPDNSVDLIATDPPYYRVKNETWDRQWDKPKKFIAWIGELCREWRRLLKPNGSLYVFASPKMAARVEVTIGDQFEVLNRIRWMKANGWHRKAEQEALRSYLSPWEEIIFAEHKGADGGLYDEGSYNTALGRVREVAFGDLHATVVGMLNAIPGGDEAINKMFCTQNITFHWRHLKTFNIPTERNWDSICSAFPKHVELSWHELKHRFDNCRIRYEELRREYEELRRPFTVSADVPYTDVWDFPTVSTYPGKHPCEKPLEMMRHIVRASSRPGAMVLDCFAGSGTTGLAAKLEGRSAVLIEREPKWVDRIHTRLKTEHPRRKLQPPDDALPLFAGLAA